jgi:hypothetical protein
VAHRTASAGPSHSGEQTCTIARFAIAGGFCAARRPRPVGRRQTVRTLYENTFEAGELGSVWSTNTKLAIAGSTLTTFNGNYSNSFTRLSLAAASRPQNVAGSSTFLFNRYTVKFDLYILDSWDGDETTYGVDRLKVLGQRRREVRLEPSRTTPGITQSFRSPDVSGSNLGFARVRATPSIGASASPSTIRAPARSPFNGRMAAFRASATSRGASTT